MSTQLMKTSLEDGRYFYFEQDDPAGTPIREVGISDTLGQLDFESSLEAIKAAASRLGESLVDMPRQPDSFELTFGVKLSTAVGVILAKAGAEANFTVKMTWSAKKP